MSGECQVNVKSLSELDIGGRETCNVLFCKNMSYLVFLIPWCQLLSRSGTGMEVLAGGEQKDSLLI